MKKRNNKEIQFETMNKKIVSAVFARKANTNFFAAGDSENNLLVYNVHNHKPLTVLNSQTSNVSQITALIFASNEDQIVAGSNRGSINVWDLNTLQISYCLKGHTVEVGCFGIDTNKQNILASGSYDTNVKLWDLRNKSCIHVLKEHSGQIKSIALTPDSRYILSGSEDGLIKFWDIKMLRPVYDYQVGATVKCLEVHKKSMMVAAGCQDRMARIYQLNTPYSLLSTTKNQSMPVVSCRFYKQGYLFTSASDSLKVWNVKKGCSLLDNIQSSCRGVIDLHIAETHTQQIAYSNNSLSLHVCQLSTINFNDKAPEQFPSNIKINHSSIEELPKKTISKNMTNSEIRSTVQKRGVSINKTMVNDVQKSVGDALNSIQRLGDVGINRPKQDTSQLFKLVQEHSKFMNVMSIRARTIQKILELWSTRNVKAIISMLKDAQIYVVADVLSNILKPCKYPISVQFGVVISKNAKEMILAKHMTLIKHGLTFMIQILSLFRDDIIKIKTYPIDNRGVDLSREQRMKQYDNLIQVLIEVYNNPRLKKLLGKKQELCKLAQQLYNQLGYLFKKIFNNQELF